MHCGGMCILNDLQTSGWPGDFGNHPSYGFRNAVKGGIIDFSKRMMGLQPEQAGTGVSFFSLPAVRVA